MSNPVIDQHVTHICELGCTRVEQVISLLQQGNTPPETADLNPAQRQQVLHELQAIMAVYTPHKNAPDKGGPSKSDQGKGKKGCK